jgi:hypothetical protein
MSHNRGSVHRSGFVPSRTSFTEGERAAITEIGRLVELILKSFDERGKADKRLLGIATIQVSRALHIIRDGLGEVWTDRDVLEFVASFTDDAEELLALGTSGMRKAPHV